MIRLSQLVGQRLVAREQGAFVGSIKRLLLEPARGGVTAAHIETPEGRQQIVDWQHVTGIATDAVLVSGSDIGRPARGQLEEELIAGRLELLGKPVLTDRGDALGELEDAELDEISGRVTRLHVPDQAVTVGRLVALGPDALIIAPTRTTSRTASAR